MDKKDLQRICICLSQKEYENLRLLASLRKESMSAFVRYLLNIHLQANESLLPLIKGLKESIAKQS